MKSISFIIVLLLCSVANAQTFEWLRTQSITFNMNSDMISYPSASDNLNNTYVCGLKDSPYAYTDIFGNVDLVKYDQNGNIVATKNITGKVHAYKLITDNDNNLYMAVGYINSIAFEDFSLTTNNQGDKPLLLKFNASGQLQWHKEFTGDFISHFESLAIDAQQNVYIGYDNYQHSYIEKLNSNGNTLQLIMQSDVRQVSSISVDTEGNIYAAGSCAETNAVYNGAHVSAPFLYNTYLVKYNPSGQMQWIQYVQDITCTNPMVVARTPDEVYFCSYLFDSFPVGGLPTEGPPNGSFNDFFLARFNSSGVAQWVREVPGSGVAEMGHRNFLALDGQGNVYFAGQTRGIVQWNPTTTTQTSAFSNQDALILKYSPEGNVIWAKTAGGAAYDRTDGISVLSDGNVIITGMANQTISFDGIQHISPAFQYYPYIAKLSTNVLGSAEFSSSKIVVFPNPTSGILHIKTDSYTGSAGLYSILGQQLKNFFIAEAFQLDLNDFATGAYFLKIGQQTIKVIKE